MISTVLIWREDNFLFDFGQAFKENNDTTPCLLGTGLAERLRMGIDRGSSPRIITESRVLTSMNGMEINTAINASPPNVIFSRRSKN